ncbi:MAG: NnrS family protein, partial [Tistlia sp.]
MSAIRQAVPRYRPWAGPALFKEGFRPLFLGSALWAAAALLLWLLALQGSLVLPSALDPMTWHVHEMLFGYVAATLAGFLLTAIPNWTGRMPLQGWPLVGLALLWLAGRLAGLTSGWIGVGTAAAVDLSFLGVMLAVVLREIVAGSNWRNLPMAGALALVLAANGLMHAEAAGLLEGLPAGLGWRLAIAVILLLISLIGGRIIPSFTRNWLSKRGASALPAAFGPLDKLALIATGLAGLFWTLFPESNAMALAALAAAVLQALRLARWRGLATLSEPLVWSLHLAYAWLPVGFALLAASRWSALVPVSMAIHALTAG